MIRVKLSDIISVQFLNKLLIRKHSFQHTLLTVKYKLYKPLCHFQFTQIQKPVSPDRKDTFAFFC